MTRHGTADDAEFVIIKARDGQRSMEKHNILNRLTTNSNFFGVLLSQHRRSS